MHLNWLRPHSSCSGSLPPLIARTLRGKCCSIVRAFLHLSSSRIPWLFRTVHPGIVAVPSFDEATVSPQHDARWFTWKEKTILQIRYVPRSNKRNTVIVKSFLSTISIRYCTKPTMGAQTRLKSSYKDRDWKQKWNFYGTFDRRYYERLRRFPLTDANVGINSLSLSIITRISRPPPP